MKKENEDAFKYTYSSREHSEIESIVKKYLPAQENDLQLLKKLDAPQILRLADEIRKKTK